MKRTRMNRFLAGAAVLAAVAGVLFFLGDGFIRDQAMLFAGCAALALAVALASMLMPLDVAENGSPWESVAWGKFFVAAVYASLAVVFVIAAMSTPDAARFAHLFHAVG